MQTPLGRAGQACSQPFQKPTQGNPSNKKRKTGKSARRRRNRANRNRKTNQAGLNLSHCARAYLKAVTDPFDIAAEGACIPDLVDTPSQKLRTMIRGTFTTGDSVGFIALNSNGNTSTNPIGVCTSGTYAGSTVQYNGAVGIVNVYDYKFPYSASSLPGYGVRTVSCAVRVRYIGTQLNMGGVVLCVRSQGTWNLDGTDFQSASQMPVARTHVANRGWSSISTVPNTMATYDYTSTPQQYDNLDLCILVSGAPKGNTFEYEVVYHREVISKSLVPPNMTESHSDLPGLSVIRDFFSKEGILSELGPRTFTKALEYIQNYGGLSQTVPFLKAGLAAARMFAQPGAGQMRLEF